jgi:hypothetical protein
MRKIGWALLLSCGLAISAEAAPVGTAEGAVEGLQRTA